MAPENVRRRKIDKRYSFVIVPSGDSTNPRTYSLSRWGIIAVLSGICVVFITLVLVLVVYTPVGRLLPISHPEMEFVYGRQLVEIQEQLNSLLGEINSLRAYNVHLRRALGESVSREDSTFLAQHQEEAELQQYRRTGDTTKSNAIASRGASQSAGYVPQSTGSSFETAQEHPLPEISADLPFGSPARGYFTRGFDAPNGHFGVDIAGNDGSPVSAAAGGRVIFAGWTYDYGFEIILEHDKGYTTVYKHNQALMKKVGDEVRRGELIALLGNTGSTSSGPHLHFEVWKNGSVQNPMNYLINVQ